MTLPVLVSLLLAAGAQPYATASTGDPAVEVWFDSEGQLERGDRTRVFARAADDGFLLVLHADADGRVRVLHPIDPFADDFVRGGETLEIRGRSDREAIFVDERDGAGVVLAAWSRDPYRFDGWVRGDHWDYRLMSTVGERDAEAALLDVVHRMADGRAFDYDVAHYVVGGRPYRSPVRVAVGFGTGWCFACWSGPWYGGPGFSFSIRIGDPWWDPYFAWRPYFYRPIYVDPYWHRARWAWGHGWWRNDPWDRHWRPRGSVHIRYAWSSPCWDDPWCRRDPWRRARPGRASGTWLAGDSDWSDRRAVPLLDPSRADRTRFSGGTRVIAEPERRLGDRLTRVIAEPERPLPERAMRTITQPERPSSSGSPSTSRGIRVVEPEPSREDARGRFDGGRQITRPSEQAQPTRGTLWSRGAGFIQPGTDPSRTRAIPADRVTRRTAGTSDREAVPRPSRSLSDIVRSGGARSTEDSRTQEPRSVRPRSSERPAQGGISNARPRPPETRGSARPSESNQGRARPSSGSVTGGGSRPSSGISGARPRSSSGGATARPARTATRRGGND